MIKDVAMLNVYDQKWSAPRSYAKVFDILAKATSTS
jgi:hypothetical protein